MGGSCFCRFSRGPSFRFNSTEFSRHFFKIKHIPSKTSLLGPDEPA